MTINSTSGQMLRELTRNFKYQPSEEELAEIQRYAEIALTKARSDQDLIEHHSRKETKLPWKVQINKGHVYLLPGKSGVQLAVGGKKSPYHGIHYDPNGPKTVAILKSSSEKVCRSPNFHHDELKKIKSELDAYEKFRGNHLIGQVLSHGIYQGSHAKQSSERYQIIAPIAKMDFADLITLRHQDGEGLSKGQIEELLVLFEDMAQGIKLLHDAHIIHRDIKPENFLIFEGALRDHVAVWDLGLSCQNPDIEDFKRLAGTPAYIAPECFQRSLRHEPVFNSLEEAKSGDIYSLGNTMYSALSNRLFDMASKWQRIKQSRMPPMHKAQLMGQKARKAYQTFIEEETPLDYGLKAQLLAKIVPMLDPDPERRPNIDAVIASLQSLQTTIHHGYDSA